MDCYVGLDVAQSETAVCVIDGAGKRLWQGICRFDARGDCIGRAPQGSGGDHDWDGNWSSGGMALARAASCGSARGLYSCQASEGRTPGRK